jgi:hypothetical protein
LPELPLAKRPSRLARARREGIRTK